MRWKKTNWYILVSSAVLSVAASVFSIVGENPEINLQALSTYWIMMIGIRLWHTSDGGKDGDG